MPEKRTIKASRKAKREGKASSTQAGPFVHEEIEHVRAGKHGARSAKQAIAIGLAKARRAGVKLPPRPPSAGERTKPSARSASARRRSKPSPARSRAARAALQDDPTNTASSAALSRQAKAAARRRTAASRRASARKAARTRARSAQR
jgi:hypothetical protein